MEPDAARLHLPPRRPDDVAERYGWLIERAKAACARAVEETERSEELMAFVRALRKAEPGDVLQCAWCERVSAEGYWVDPSRLLKHNLPARIRDITTHGICPDCFERLTDAD